jgi:hypothetical protein
MELVLALKDHNGIVQEAVVHTAVIPIQAASQAVLMNVHILVKKNVLEEVLELAAITILTLVWNGLHIQ